MSAGALAARVLREVGPVTGALVVVAPRAGRLARALRAAARGPAGAEAGGAVVSFLGCAGDPAARQQILDGLRARLPSGAPVVLIDHNRPRRWPGRLAGAAVLLLAGRRPARARYPAARELAALGFTVERLRLARAERVQVVVARRP
ncbi:MAG: hypothetical protein U0807_11600 [Candidatus Binatia bacterium]